MATYIKTMVKGADTILPRTRSAAVTMDDGTTTLDEKLDAIDNRIDILSGTDVAIVDSGSYYTGTNVETALQEVGGSFDAVDGMFEGTVQTPTITYGQNLITNVHIADAYPDITFQGQHHVNLLGADGNCEDVSKWVAGNATLALDTTKKVFGANAIKFTLTTTYGGMYKALSSFGLDVSKYYILSAYVDKGTATNIDFGKNNYTGGVAKNVIATPTTPTRYGVKVQPSDMVPGNLLTIYANGAIGQYGYVDGIQVNEISATEYANDSVDVLMARYPYVDSYACLQNPAVEVVHDNMVRNGNGEEGIAWWNLNLSPSKAAFENGYFTITDDDVSVGEGITQTFACLPNQMYSVRHVYKAGTTPARIVVSNINASGASTAIIDKETVNTTDTVETFSFTTLSDAKLIVVRLIAGATAVGTCYHKECMLIPGTVAPTAYKPQRREQVVIEGKFATGDTVRLKDGKLEGSLLWEHKTLYGRDWAWEYNIDYTGFKGAKLLYICNGVDGSEKAVKFDGKILTTCLDATGMSTTDQIKVSESGGYIYVTMSDTDTGWAETIAPNADEVKAFMNGWKANANNGTRYTSWVSVVDGSAPATNTIAYVMANVAPLYKGYQLHYQLANPKAVNEYNCRLKGVLPKLENGMNVVNVDAGLVIGEVANPVLLSGTYYVNRAVVATTLASVLSNPTEVYIQKYRNRVADSQNWAADYNGGASVPWLIASILSASFDPKAQYTVDYTILRTQAPVVGTPSMEYLPGVTEKVESQVVQSVNHILSAQPSNDFGNDGDTCIVNTSPADVGVKVKGKWEMVSGMVQAPSGTAIPATSGTIAVTMDGKFKYIQPAGNCTFNATLGAQVGDRCTFEISTVGTTSYTLTWGAYFRASGTLATGTVANKVFMVSFIFDGGAWVETGRTGAIA